MKKLPTTSSSPPYAQKATTTSPAAKAGTAAMQYKPRDK